MMAYVATEAQAELVHCRDCGQLIARRYPGGGLEVVVKGERYEPDGRVAVNCPACGLRIRMNPRRKVS